MEPNRSHAATPFAPAAVATPHPAVRLSLALTLALLGAGCESIRPYVPPSEGHIAKPAAKPGPDQAIPPPARVSEFLPPPKPEVKPQTYSVVVNEVPVKDLLLALARDTKQNIDIHPGLTGLVSLNAINETLPAILERVSKQVNLRYRTEGNTIIVSPDMAFVKTYRVNYVNMARETTSSVGVTGEIGTSGGGAQGTGVSGSSTVVRTTTRNDFWEQLRDNIRSLLNSTRLQSLTAEAKAERLALVKQEQELRAKQIEAASRAGQGAPALATSFISGAPGAAGQQQSALLPDDVIVNAVSGTVTVNATEKQHQLVQQHIDSIVNAMQRQVLIEATIVEVILNDAYQAGIDWRRLAITGGVNVTQTVSGGFAAAAQQGGAAVGNALTIGYVNPASGLGNISITLKLLEEFGNTRVLSSPKLMALNNQTALLKVVDNLVYFEVQTQAGTSTAGGVLTPATTNTTPKTVAIGVVMAVTPQINEDGRVFLNVRPTVTRLKPDERFKLDPNPALAAAGVTNPVPQVQTREMESVLQVGSGQTVIMGGLMQDEVRRAREQVPGADNIGVFGELFRFRDERATKSELVIFIKPTVIANPTLESDELRFFQRFLPVPDAPPQRPTPERTGAAR
jgi:MSHA type pilus biogenesis protein MshL